MKKNKIILFLLALIFIAPSLCAYLFYAHPTWRSAQTINKGELISPVEKLTLFNESKWHLVFWSPKACTTACMERLEKLTKLRLALGRRYYNVDLWLILTDTSSAPSNIEIQLMKTHDVHWLRLPKENKYVKQLQSYPASLLIATPQQSLILRYNPFSDLNDIYHDLKHLLTTTDGKNVS